MFVFRLGIVSVLLSDTLVSGFTTGAAVHVLTSQIKDLLGLNIPRHKGLFVIINVRIAHVYCSFHNNLIIFTYFLHVVDKVSRKVSVDIFDYVVVEENLMLQYR